MTTNLTEQIMALKGAWAELEEIEPIKLIDISHWQDPVDWRKAKAAGISGVYIKVSQGATHKDDRAKIHYEGARAEGLLVGCYHFCTNDNATAQYNNLLDAVLRINDVWDLPPALDCEAYTSYGGFRYGLSEFINFAGPLKYGLDILDYTEHRYSLGEETIEEVVLRLRDYTETVLSLTYPSSAIIDSIGRKLLKHHLNVAIYTNQASGNRIFGNQDVFGRRYQLWVANWTSAAAPALPAAWKGKPWMNWQKGVVDGAQYGVTGKVDYNEWGTSLPWPGNEEPPVPPPVPTQKARVILKIDGKFRTFEEIDG